MQMPRSDSKVSPLSVASVSQEAGSALRHKGNGEGVCSTVPMVPLVVVVVRVEICPGQSKATSRHVTIPEPRVLIPMDVARQVPTAGTEAAIGARDSEQAVSDVVILKPVRLSIAPHAGGRARRQPVWVGNEMDILVEVVIVVVDGLRALRRQSRILPPRVDVVTVTARQDAMRGWRVRLPRVAEHKANWVLTCSPLTLARFSQATDKAGRLGVGSNVLGTVGVNVLVMRVTLDGLRPPMAVMRHCTRSNPCVPRTMFLVRHTATSIS